ncbi:phosphate ABC transporter substrate-binding protein [Leptospira dzoumogneensis]|uniref:Phosphate ABC transporter substrate-binding protein n=1 Tax=Leptospira dzoumogneensis TaxID=2484904 RepID=A0A4Z1AKQ6_9LEPT|nr:phosphate ABC transporter substrate-binding protein [Leptospira dzoumogneensis]TGN00295.1 phosphate ABC transporter substrate-binding protein [Leptospira dzoumogneensis]
MKQKLTLLLLMFTVLTVANCKKEPLLITGSETMHTLLNVVAAGYAKKNPNIEVTVQGGGSFEGIEKLFEAKTDIAASSRPLTPEEQTQFQRKGRFENVLIGYDGIAIVVNPANTVSKLTLEQISKIFSGDIKDWSQVGGKPGPIHVVLRNDKSGTAAYFETHILRQRDLGEKEYQTSKKKEFTNDSKVVADNDEMADLIEKDTASVGFMGMGSAQIQNKGKVKAIPYSKTGKDPYVEPSIQNVSERKYKLSRGLYLFYLSDRGKKIDEFITYITSEEGQTMVLKSGYLRSTLSTVEVEAIKP